MLVALVVRFVYLVWLFHGQPIPVGNRYVIGFETGSIAASLASGQGFSSPLSVPSGPSAWITPLYPLLLAVVFKLFGIFTHASSLCIRSLDVIFSAATCWPIYSLGKKLFGSTVGVTAAWIWAFLPGSIFFSVVWVWDTSLSALVLSVALLLTYLVADRNDARAWIGYGFFWGITALVNAAVLSVLPGCLAFAAFQSKKRKNSWFKFASLATFAFIVTVSPWIIRNQIVFHHQVYFRSNFGLELWLGNNPQVPDSWTWWRHPNDDKAERARYLEMGEVPYMQEKERLAVDFMKTHPSDVARFIFHRFVENWSGSWDSLYDNWSTGDWGAGLTITLNYAFTLLSFAGLLLAYRRNSLLSIPLLNLLALFPVVYYICHPSLRYRHPIDPAMTVLVAFAIVSAVRSIHGKVTEPGVASEKVKI